MIKIERLLDANFNRSREGLRVCEDILRFIVSDRKLSSELKELRHRLTGLLKTYPLSKLIRSRNAREDIGSALDSMEKSRADWQDIYGANLERAKESVRVLEEVSKLLYPSKVGRLKKIRFELYDHEKRSFKKISSLRHRSS